MIKRSMTLYTSFAHAYTMTLSFDKRRHRHSAGLVSFPQSNARTTRTQIVSVPLEHMVRGDRKAREKSTLPLKRDIDEGEGLNDYIDLRDRDDGDTPRNLGNNQATMSTERLEGRPRTMLMLKGVPLEKILCDIVGGVLDATAIAILLVWLTDS